MSKGHVHDLKTGRHDDVLWARGEKLRKLHSRLMRRQHKASPLTIKAVAPVLARLAKKGTK